ncbi:MAG: SH3 domain-containing protein [Chloroflexi bacterium]|nr:SH3 domain-containing protein [Chloroflexota bacterium]
MKLLTSLLLMAVMVVSAAQQAADCPTLVQTALESLDDLCAATQRNQLCYGHELLSVEVNNPAVRLQAPGDIADIAGVISLQTAGMLLPDVWGLALIQVQANLPDTLPGQNVAILVLGDVAITDAAQGGVRLSASNPSGMNLRAGPSTNYAVITTLAADSAITLVGRSEAGDWVYGISGTFRGWLSASLLSIEGDVMTLAVVPDDFTPFAPMQAFYFRSAVGDSACAEAPESGIVIRSPQLPIPIELRINGVGITLGSTAFLQAQPGQTMTISVLEGQAAVTAQDQTVVIPAGESTSVELDENLSASSPPGEPQAFNTEAAAPVPAAPLPPAPEGDVFAGVWTGIDLDGSFQTIVITALGGGQYNIEYYDDGASICGTDSAGRPLYGGLGNVQATASGNSLTSSSGVFYCYDSSGSSYNFTYSWVYDPTSDTMTSEYGTWQRG